MACDAGDSGIIYVRRSDIWEMSSIAVVKCLVDKLIIYCLRDSELRCLFTDCNLSSIKLLQTERLVRTLRQIRTVDGQVAGHDIALSAPVQAQLVEGTIASMHQCLANAFLEVLRDRTQNPCPQVGQALVERLLSVEPKLILGLLPSDKLWDEQQNDQSKPHRNVLGAKVAPLHVPIPRRVEAFACGCVVYLPIIVFFLLAWITYHFRLTWPVILFYPIYALMDKAPHERKLWRQARQHIVFKRCADYFPATLIKSDPTSKWDTTVPYMIGYHPHGVCGFGAALAFGTDALGWNLKFPDLDIRLATVFMKVRVPLLWEFLSRLGGISGNRATLVDALKPGRVVVVNVGGRQEFLDHTPGQYVLTVRAHKDFFKTALQRGASLVPAFGFGENQLFTKSDQLNGSMGSMQLWIEQHLGMSVPLFNGRHLFTYNAGPMPFRQRLTVVVGQPIPVDQCDGIPTEEQVNLLQDVYVEALRALFEDWQPKCEPDVDTELIIL